MNKVFLTLAFALAASTSSAAESGVGYGGSVGALTMETRGVATNDNEVRSQGGFVTAGAVRWTQVPAARQRLGTVAY